MKNKRIVVLVGGPSAEAEVSRRTGKAVYEALLRKGYQAECKELDQEHFLEEAHLLKESIVFNALHGKYGEDGSIQGVLELLQVPYTGSGIMASAIGMNKEVAKHLFEANQISTSPFKEYHSHNMTIEAVIALIEEDFTYPLVLKSASQGGSSIGVAIVYKSEDLEDAVQEIRSIDENFFVEQYLDGQEFTVALLDGKAMPVIMIQPHSGYYSYESKYTVGATEYLVPAPISEELTKKIQALAEKAYKAVHCAGVARVDVMTDRQGTPYVLEVNTVPGMTETSLVPKAAKAMGITFDDLCEHILETASYDKW